MKRLLAGLLIVLVAAGAVFALRERRDPVTSRTEYLMDTVVEIKVAEKDSPKVQQALDRAFQEMKRLNKLLSSYDPKSDVSRINKNAGIRAVKVSRDTFEVISESLRYYRLSDGALDITVGPLVRLWGIGSDKQHIPSQNDIRRILPLVNARNIKINKEASTVKLLKKGMSIDLGAIAKGYAVDSAARIIDESSISSALINAGSSSIRIVGKRRDGHPWRIGVEDPRAENRLLGVLELTEGSVGTSADTQRFFIRNGQRYHHIIDPGTGLPARGTRAITVLCRSAAEADALSTAMFVMDLPKALQLARDLPGVKIIGVDDKGKVRKTKGFPRMMTIEE